jgi:hypothetical protein
MIIQSLYRGLVASVSESSVKHDKLHGTFVTKRNTNVTSVQRLLLTASVVLHHGHGAQVCAKSRIRNLRLWYGTVVPQPRWYDTAYNNTVLKELPRYTLMMLMPSVILTPYKEHLPNTCSRQTVLSRAFLTACMNLNETDDRHAVLTYLLWHIYTCSLWNSCVERECFDEITCISQLTSFTSCMNIFLLDFIHPLLNYVLKPKRFWKRIQVLPWKVKKIALLLLTLFQRFLTGVPRGSE